MDEFYTRETANEGRKLPLYTPGGKKTEHYLIVRGIDSDAFRIAESLGKRKALEIAAIDAEEQRAKAILEEERVVIASLVAGWSFEQECTKENVLEFLRKAPQIGDKINEYAGRRSLFFAASSSDSTDGQEPNLNSSENQKGQK